MESAGPRWPNDSGTLGRSQPYSAPMANDPVQLARSLHNAIGAGRHGDDLRHFFTSSAIVVEAPNQFNPSGGSYPVAEFLAKSTSGAELLQEQRYELVGAHRDGDTAILRLRWVGVVKHDRGPLAAGQVLIARIAQFVSTDGERITRIETYDCFEPSAQDPNASVG